MARTAFYAPAHRVLAKTPLGAGGAPADIAPSLDWGGAGFMDPRLAYNVANSATAAGIIGWLDTGDCKTLGYVPAAVATANIVALAHTTNGTAMTKVTSSGAGINVVGASGQLVLPSLVTVPSGACCIDAIPAPIRSAGGASGGHFYTAFYNPLNMGGRAVSVTTGTAGTGGTIVIKGYDVYGYPMTQNIAASATGSTTVNGTKAFKFITSVTPQFTDATGTYSVGTTDIYGFPVAADYFADTTIYWNNVVQLVAQFTAAVTTTATATTGDVRGTFTAPSASDGTKRLDLYIEPTLSRIMQVPQSVGLFGVSQF